MRARVDLEVLGACEHLAAVGKCARERLLPGVHANVVNEFVFGFERLPAAHTLVPHADVTEGLEPRRYMLRGDVVHQLVHGAESLVADGCRRPPEHLSRRSSVNPFTDQLGFDGGAFGEIQQAVHPAAGNPVGRSGDPGGSRLRWRDDAGSPGVVVPQRRNEAIVPGHYSRPLHAQRGGLPRSRLLLQSSLPRKNEFSPTRKACAAAPRPSRVRFGVRESACGGVFTPRCSVLDPGSQSLHAVIYCVNGGERSRRNTAGCDPTLSRGVLVSFPSGFLSSFPFLFFN